MQGDEERDHRASAAGPNRMLAAGRLSAEGGAIRRRALDAARRTAT